MGWFKTISVGSTATVLACSDPTSFNPEPRAGIADASVGVGAGDAMTAKVTPSVDAMMQSSATADDSSLPSMPSTLVPCVDPTQSNCAIAADNVNKVCPASQEWVPTTPPLPASLLFKPLQHPFPECPFYRFGFQNFLIATQPDPTSGEAAIVTYPTIDDAFTKTTPLRVGALAPAGMHRGTAMRAWLGDIKQAGQRQIVVDQSGHTLYYGIHVNQAFVDFINTRQTKLANGQSVPLSTLAGVRNADANLFLPSGLVEFKSAWKDIDVKDGVSAADNASFVSTYVTTMAWIPSLSQDAQGNLIESRDKPIQRQMALVALHVVYTIPGHPEFVWASFQHIDQNGNADTAGLASVHPPMTDPYNAMNSENVCPADAGTNFLLCRPGTLAKEGNAPYKDQDFKLGGADGQTFLLKTTGAVAQTSIYRMFPGSKSNSDVPDDDVVSLNTNMDAVWAQAGVEGTIDPNDRRMNYHLVGATWMDKPAVFTVNSPFQNSLPNAVTKDPGDPLLAGPDAGGGVEQADERAAIWPGGLSAVADDLAARGTESPFSILGGEERMSSTAMESYTQSPSSFFNCFTCHNTQAVTTNGVPSVKDSTSLVLLPPKLLNVSHVFSQFVLEECTLNGKLIAGAPAACTQ